jgi:hypothetical protein
MGRFYWGQAVCGREGWVTVRIVLLVQEAMREAVLLLPLLLFHHLFHRPFPLDADVWRQGQCCGVVHAGTRIVSETGIGIEKLS